MLTRVDFPAPFGPMTAVIRPGSTSKDTSSIDVTAPNRLVTWSNRSIIGGGEGQASNPTAVHCGAINGVSSQCVVLGNKSIEGSHFDHPLPAPIGELREGFYRRLAPVANRWSERLGGAADAFPPEHEQLLERCRESGQERPTPLILRYGEGDWNALH